MVGDIFQPTHLLFVLVVALLVLGPKRLPEVGRTLGAGIRDFRQALSGEKPDRPERQDSEQVAATTSEPHQQPDTVVDDFAWPEEAIGPTSYDEPVEAATAEPTVTEPTTAVFTEPESQPTVSGPTTAAVADRAASPEAERAAAPDAEPAVASEPKPTTDPESELAAHLPADETQRIGEIHTPEIHAPTGEADTIVENRDSTESHPGQSI